MVICRPDECTVIFIYTAGHVPPPLSSLDLSSKCTSVSDPLGKSYAVTLFIQKTCDAPIILEFLRDFYHFMIILDILLEIGLLGKLQENDNKLFLENKNHMKCHMSELSDSYKNDSVAFNQPLQLLLYLPPLLSPTFPFYFKHLLFQALRTRALIE